MNHKLLTTITAALLAATVLTGCTHTTETNTYPAQGCNGDGITTNTGRCLTATEYDNLPPCPEEDGSNGAYPCTWNATQQGNGHGHNITYLEGK